ncbi:cheX protein [Phenylobacterium zucineum HLK1]|uniref:CheX protein n=1 Tax=Phenylobacterium zucineum (strain HLK1) TaxID=450851 RepID=B4RBE5_PHEZH|nr:STAS domain-containing protein [Phenylobacterium zucineum]ACG79790.1 cheX protein [Phenylobacterium zucineum HLK1]
MAGDDDNAPAALRLPPVLDLNAAAPLADELTGLRGRPVTLDGSAVQRLGAQCLQVLLSARATWEADGLGFGLSEPSAEMVAALELLGAPAEQTFPIPELSR